MKTWLMNLATGVLVVCALAITGLVVRRELFPSSAQASETVMEPAWREYAAQGQRMGPAAAPVTLVVFSDFQCPACATLAGTLREVRERDPGRVNVVFRHFPLPNHPHAVKAARASECAAAQGRFEAFHDAAFEHQDEIGTRPWTRLAADAQVPNTAAFATCLAGETGAGVVRRDIEAGMRMRLQATPTLLINGRRVEGAPPAGRLEDLIREAAAQAR